MVMWCAEYSLNCSTFFSTWHLWNHIIRMNAILFLPPPPPLLPLHSPPPLPPLHNIVNLALSAKYGRLAHSSPHPHPPPPPSPNTTPTSFLLLRILHSLFGWADIDSGFHLHVSRVPKTLILWSGRLQFHVSQLGGSSKRTARSKSLLGEGPRKVESWNIFARFKQSIYFGPGERFLTILLLRCSEEEGQQQKQQQQQQQQQQQSTLLMRKKENGSDEGWEKVPFCWILFVCIYACCCCFLLFFDIFWGGGDGMEEWGGEVGTFTGVAWT